MGVIIDFLTYLLHGHPEHPEQDEDTAYTEIYGERERRSSGILSVAPAGSPPEGEGVLAVEPLPRELPVRGPTAFKAPTGLP